MTHIAGKKIAKKHSTIIDEAKSIVKKAIKLDLVSKVVIGEIKVITRGCRRIKFKEVPAGLEIMIRAINVRQKIFIYTKEKELVKDFLNKDFNL